MRVSLTMRIFRWLAQREANGLTTDRSSVYDYWIHQKHNNNPITNADVTVCMESHLFSTMVEDIEGV